MCPPDELNFIYKINKMIKKFPLLVLVCWWLLTDPPTWVSQCLSLNEISLHISCFDGRNVGAPRDGGPHQYIIYTMECYTVSYIIADFINILYESEMCCLVAWCLHCIVSCLPTPLITPVCPAHHHHTCTTRGTSTPPTNFLTRPAFPTSRGYYPPLHHRLDTWVLSSQVLW